MGHKFEGGNLIESIDPQSVLEGMSKKNLKHSIKHLSEFQQLDPTITKNMLRKIGSSIVKSENYVSNPESSQKAFEQILTIGITAVKVRVVLNERNKLHSIHIKYR